MMCPELPRLSPIVHAALCLLLVAHSAQGQALPTLPPAQAAPSAPEAPQAPGFADPYSAAAQDPGATDGLDNGVNELALAGASEPMLESGQAFNQDPPGRTGRVRVFAGKASVRASGQTLWLDAASNRPFVTGDALWVGPKGRAVVQLGATTLFVGAETAVTAVALDDQLLHLLVTQGQIFVHLGQGSAAGQVQLQTPVLTAGLQQQGDYSLVSQGGDTPRARTTFVVRQGTGDVHMGSAQVTVSQGERLRSGGREARGYTLTQAPAAAGLEAQSLRAVAQSGQVEALRYVSADMVGYDELDAHGTWSQAPEYGALWMPRRVPARWAPYRFGHWANIAPWGYTWVDDAPWGFAPFHYGRWVHLPRGWAWAPGPLGRRPVYAPHLVSFGQAPGRRDVAWVPLGYGDPFVPAYGASGAYLQGINFGSTQVIVGVGPGGGWANSSVPGAITIVPWGVWGGGLGVGSAFGVGPAHVFGPGAFGSPLPPGRPPRGYGRPQGYGYPQGARPGSALPPRGALPPYGAAGSAPGPRLSDVRYGSTPGGRAGGPYVPRGLPSGGASGRGPYAPPTRPPVGRYEPMPMGHPNQPGVGHPGFPGHMGAPSYHGGGGYPGGRIGGPNRTLGGGYGSRRGGR